MSQTPMFAQVLESRLENPRQASAVVSDHSLAGIIPRIVTSDLSLEDKLAKVLANRFLPNSIKALWAKKFVHLGADVSTRNHVVLRWASEHGDLELVQCAVAKGANLHCLKDEPLVRAAINGHDYVVQYLLNEGADVHARRDAALRLSASMGHASIVAELVASGAKVTAKRNESIRKAFDGGHSGVLKVLLDKKGADILTYAQTHQDLQVFAIAWDYAQKQGDASLTSLLELYPYRPNNPQATLNKPFSFKSRLL